MHLPLLRDLLILLGFSAIIVLFLKRAKLPSILGFLVTGILIGPYSLSLINDNHEVEIIAEIGVILLMFVIGMELSLKQLASIKKTVFIGGTIQVFVSIAATAAIYSFFSTTWSEAVFMGFLASLSSTAIVLTMYQDRNEMSSAQGRNALGILIFQDLIVVPMMLVTPIISGHSENVLSSVLSLLFKSAGVIIITVISAKYIIPRIFYEVAKTRSKELFLLTTLTVCFAVAFLTSEAGLSLALGAFLAGLIVSESEYSHQATSFVLPFRALFTSFFFISIGMMLDLTFLASKIGMILALSFGVLIVKGSIVTLSVLILRYSIRTALLTGLALFQVGEFAFILSKVGIEYGLLSETMNQFFLAVSIISMLITPFVFMFSDRIVSIFMRTRVGNALDQKLSKVAPPFEAEPGDLRDHLVIIGYSLNGSHMARAASAYKIPYIIIEEDAEIVKQERLRGVPILFGNATHTHILEKVNLRNSRAVVISISDIHETELIVRTVRTICQTTYVVVRSKFIKETDKLIALGVDDVIPEEFETSIEISSRILHRFLIPHDDIDNFISLLRSDNYQLLENQKKLPLTFKPPSLPNLNITTLKVSRDSGGPVGKAIGDSNIRKEYGINIVGICRNDEMLFHFGADEKILRNDLLFVYGEPQNMNKFHETIS